MKIEFAGQQIIIPSTCRDAQNRSVTSHRYLQFILSKQKWIEPQSGASCLFNGDGSFSRVGFPNRASSFSRVEFSNGDSFRKTLGDGLRNAGLF